MTTPWPPGWDTSWASVGATSNTDYYVDNEGILLALPHAGSHDTGPTAVENLTFQRGYYDERNDAPIVAIYFDRMASQNRDARKMYANHQSLAHFWGFALIGGTMLSRAMGSFFLGLSRPQAPLKMFGNLDAARPWFAQLRRDNQDPSR